MENVEYDQHGPHERNIFKYWNSKKPIRIGLFRKAPRKGWVRQLLDLKK